MYFLNKKLITPNVSVSVLKVNFTKLSQIMIDHLLLPCFT